MDTPQLSQSKVASLPPLDRSEEHTSELQSLRHLVCRLLLEKKNDAELLLGYTQEELRKRNVFDLPRAAKLEAAREQAWRLFFYESAGPRDFHFSPKGRSSL